MLIMFLLCWTEKGIKSSVSMWRQLSGFLLIHHVSLQMETGLFQWETVLILTRRQASLEFLLLTDWYYFTLSTRFTLMPLLVLTTLSLQDQRLEQPLNASFKSLEMGPSWSATTQVILRMSSRSRSWMKQNTWFLCLIKTMSTIKKKLLVCLKAVLDIGISK